MIGKQMVNRQSGMTEEYVLRCFQRSCGGRVRTYRLSCDGQDGERFRFSVEEGAETAALEATCSFTQAATLFDRILRGEIPPYVLEEILADFLSENE